MVVSLVLSVHIPELSGAVYHADASRVLVATSILASSVESSVRTCGAVRVPRLDTVASRLSRLFALQVVSFASTLSLATFAEFAVVSFAITVLHSIFASVGNAVTDD